MTDWVFGRPQALSKQRDPIQAEFFHSAESIRGDVDALVREAFQNILDQAVPSGGPVRVRVMVSGDERALPAEVAHRYFGALWPHLSGVEEATASPDDPCRYLVIEDFQTSGLVGDPATQFVVPGEPRNDFLYFYRWEGKSGKSGSDRGRWGIGKYVFPMSSGIFSFLGYTVRSNDDYDRGAGLLMGQAVMKHHVVHGVEFEPDGWWGRQSNENSIVEPFVEPSLIEQFCSDWRVQRDGEPGLSLVVPYVAGEWTAESVLGAVLEDYFIAILRGRLSVTIESAGQTYDVDASSIMGLVSEHRLATSKGLSKDIELTKWAINAKANPLPVRFEAEPKWATATWDDEQLVALTEEFEQQGRLCVSVPVRVGRTDGTLDLWSAFQVLLVQDDEVHAKALFSRGGILIKDAGRSRIHGIRAIVFIDDDPLSDMLGDAEGPAHVDWSHLTKSFQKKYRYGPRWLTVVRSAPTEILKRLRGGSDDADLTVAMDFFSVVSGPKPGVGVDGSGEGEPSGSGEGSKKTRKQVVDVPPRKPDPILLSKVPGGFALTIREGLESAPESVDGRVAYKVRRGDSFNRWDPSDFSFESSTESPRLSVVASGVHSVTYVKNEFFAIVKDPAMFRIEVCGFDENRDIEVEYQVGA